MKKHDLDCGWLVQTPALPPPILSALSGGRPLRFRVQHWYQVQEWSTSPRVISDVSCFVTLFIYETTL